MKTEISSDSLTVSPEQASSSTQAIIEDLSQSKTSEDIKKVKSEQDDIRQTSSLDNVSSNVSERNALLLDFNIIPKYIFKKGNYCWNRHKFSKVICLI